MYKHFGRVKQPPDFQGRREKIRARGSEVTDPIHEMKF